VIPRPLIDLRYANEVEQQMLEMEFPELAEIDRQRAAPEWDAALRRVRELLHRIRKWDKKYKGPKAGMAPTDPADKSPDLPEARRYLIEVVGLSAGSVKPMPSSQVLLLYISRYYHEIRDELFKVTYLPYPQAQKLFGNAEKRFKSLPDTEAAILPREFLPAITKVQAAQVRIGRKLAALQVIEAVRMHASANDGHWPTKLAEITVVPVPNDPGTDEPYEYQADPKGFTLIGRIPDQPTKLSGLRYRVMLRK
jgi:hypothetical protein